MKKIIITVVTLLVVLCCLTCPKKEDHQKAIMEVVDSAINEKTSDNNGMALFASFFGSPLIEKIVNQILEIDNYYLFNIGHFKVGDKENTVSVGILNQTIVLFNKEDLTKLIDEQSK